MNASSRRWRNPYRPERHRRKTCAINRTIDVLVGRGSTDFVQCALFGTCCYKQTGLLQAFAAQKLIHTVPHKVGCASAAAAFGPREVLGVLEKHGLSKMKRL